MSKMEKILIASAFASAILGGFAAKYVAGRIVSDVQDQYESLGASQWQR